MQWFPRHINAMAFCYQSRFFGVRGTFPAGYRKSLFPYFPRNGVASPFLLIHSWSYEANLWGIPFLTHPWCCLVLLVTGSPSMFRKMGPLWLSTRNFLSFLRNRRYIFLTFASYPRFLEIGIYFASSLGQCRHLGDFMSLGLDLVPRSSTQFLFGLLHYV